VPRGRLTIRTGGAGRLVLPIAAAATVLLAFASGYGYHRDELYFVAAGRRVRQLAAVVGDRAVSVLARQPAAGGGLDADGAAPVIAVAPRPAAVAAHLRGCRVAARIDNRARVENDERGTAVMVCRGPRRPWSCEWPGLRHLG
jgi:hypothetical protein